MTEYDEYIIINQNIPEDDLRHLKDERHHYQQKIDRAITELEQWTLIKNSMHYKINHLKRIIADHEVYVQEQRRRERV